MEGCPVLTALGDGRQVRKGRCTILVFPESFEFLLHFRSVVVGHFFIGSVVGYIGGYVLSLVERARGEMVALAVQVDYGVLVVVGGGLVELMTDPLGEFETGNLFHT